MKKLIKKTIKHDHWSAEWWSGLVLISGGIYGLLYPQQDALDASFAYGFTRFLPCNMWQTLFILVGCLQLSMLRKESLWGRAWASFCACSLLGWGTLNIFFYSDWHFSVIAWGAFALINLYALARITTGIEQKYEYFRDF